MSTAERESERGAGTNEATASDRSGADAAEDEVPGTGIMGDETLVRDSDGEPGIYPAPAAHTGGEAHPGPREPKGNADREER